MYLLWAHRKLAEMTLIVKLVSLNNGHTWAWICFFTLKSSMAASRSLSWMLASPLLKYAFGTFSFSASTCNLSIHDKWRNILETHSNVTFHSAYTFSQRSLASIQSPDLRRHIVRFILPACNIVRRDSSFSPLRDISCSSKSITCCKMRKIINEYLHSIDIEMFPISNWFFSAQPSRI